MIKTMKVNKIFKTAALVLCSAVLFSGCIKEVLPKAGSITQEQLADSDEGYPRIYGWKYRYAVRPLGFRLPLNWWLDGSPRIDLVPLYTC